MNSGPDANSPSLAPDSFLEHSRALRLLARSLLRDSAAAEDAVQSTWLRWTQSPPREPGPIRGWLQRVLRNEVAQHRRQQARSAERERRAAKRDSYDEELQRTRDESLAAVSAAVIALPTELKNVVWLRYFDDLPPREIATRLKLPIETVYQRLRRGHEVLRTKLAREFGSDRARDERLAAIAGVGEWLRKAGSSAGPVAFLASQSLWLLAGVAALVVGGIWWTLDPLTGGEALVTAVESGASAPAQDGPIDAASPVESRAAAESSDPALASVAPIDAPAREEPLEPSIPPWRRPAYEYELAVDVRDALGWPLAGAIVLAAPAGGTLNRLGATDSRGELRVRWRAFRDDVALDIGLGESGVVSLMRATLRSGSSRFGLFSRSNPVEDALDERKQRAKKQGIVLSDPAAGRMEVLRAPDAVRDSGGWLTFVDPLVADVGDVPVGAYVAPSERIESVAIDASARPPEPPLERGALLCRLTNNAPHFIDDVPVVVRALTNGELFVARSDGGLCMFANVPVGEVEVSAGGGEFEHATAQAVLEADPLQATVVTLQLQPTSLQRIRIQDPLNYIDSDSIAVHLAREQGGVLAAAFESGRGGRRTRVFEPTLSRVVLARASGSPGLPFEAEVGVTNEQHLLLLRVERSVGAARGAVSVGVRSPAARSKRAPLARIWRVGSECGADMATLSTRAADATLGAFILRELDAGEHLVEVSAPGAAQRRELRVFLREGQQLELDEQAIDPDARVRLTPFAVRPGRSNFARVLHRGAVFELLSPEFDTSQAQEFVLFAGEHALVEAATLRPIVGFLALFGEELGLCEDGVRGRRPLAAR